MKTKEKQIEKSVRKMKRTEKVGVRWVARESRAL